MTDYSDYQSIITTLGNDQNSEQDLREQVSEVINFLHHPQGQWEPRVWQDFEGRPRYTFDQMKPAIAKIWAEMAANEYTATTQPAGGGSSKEVSGIMDGLIRHIYNISSFENIATKSGKRMIATGFSCWRVVAQFIDESFYQDLKIIPLNNVQERVWFDSNSELQTREDANHVYDLQSISLDAANKKWPNRDGVFQNVDTARQSNVYSHKPVDNVTVGEILYKKKTTKTIYLLKDGNVLDDEGMKRTNTKKSDAVDKRQTDVIKVFSRKFDGHDWLEGEKETVFTFLPIIPEYANFDVNESKVTYEGVVRGLMDHQRVFNYVESRKVEEAVLAASATTWMDDRTVEGYTDPIADINRNPRAVQLYNGKAVTQEGALPPFQTEGPRPNTALTEISNDMIRDMQLTTGLPNELIAAKDAANDSNFRFDQRNSMGQLGTYEYYRAHSVALEHTAKVMLTAIPRVYDTERSINVIDEAGQVSEVLINENDAGSIVNDVTRGKYDVTMKVGPSFESRQNEANTKILEASQHIQGLAQRNADIIVNNIDAPGMNLVGDRERAALFRAGEIPEDQWTEEEKEQVAQAQAQAQNQEQQQDPASLIAQAELQRSQTEAQTAQFKSLEAQAKLEQQQQKLDHEQQMAEIKLQLEAEKTQRAEQGDVVDKISNIEKTQADILKTHADTLKTLREAIGVDTIVGPNNTEAYVQQAEITTDKQDQLDNTTP